MNPNIKKNPNFRDLMACLEIDGKRHNLYRGLNTVGRSRTATVIIKNENVSQQHAVITIIDENKQYISDFQSFNGTFLKNEKLLPLQLYNISYDSTIKFANIRAVFKQVPAETSTSEHCYNNRILADVQNTQNFTESFYVAATQAVEAASNDNSCINVQTQPENFFDDDYNFADLPSPSQMNQTANKTVPSIHDMPTQLYCSEVDNVVSVGESQLETTTSAKKDVPAASSKFTECKTGAANPDIHELPTQIMCQEVGLNVSIGDTQNLMIESDNNIVANSIYDMPTQLIDSDRINSTTCNSNVAINNTTIQKNNEYTRANKKTNDENQNKDAHQKDNLDDFCRVQDNRNKSLNSTTDVVDATVLDDSGLDVTISSLQDNQTTKTPPTTQDTIILSLGSDSQSKLHVSQLYRRTLKPIIDDSDEDTNNSVSDVEKNISKQKQKKPIPESSPENSQIPNTMNVPKSSVDNVSKIETSGSETEIEELDIAQNENRRRKKKLKLRKSVIEESSSSETDIENLESTRETAQPFKVIHKDTLISEAQKDNNKNLQNTNDSDSDVIPATQASEEDDDDFMFMPEECNTLVDKSNAERTQETIDISQKMRDLRNKTVVPEQYSEESIHLRLTETMENSEVNIQKHKENDDETDDDKTPDISDTDEPEDVSVKADQNKTAAGTTQQVGLHYNNSDINALDVETQALSEKLIEGKDDELFRKPSAKSLDRIKKINNKKVADSAKKDDDMDDLFLQPTQPLIPQNAGKSSTKSKSEEDDIFLQPTQKLNFENQNAQSDSVPSSERDDDNIFMQPTQLLISSDVVPNKPKDDDEIFLQPTQIITSDTSHIPVTNEIDDDIFMQPTQIITPDENNTPVVNQQGQQDDDIFMQPTQILESENTTGSQSPSLSLKHSSPETSEKQHSVESQLEVMFASQLTHLPPEIHSRPSNPLVNVLDKQQNGDSEKDSEESKVIVDENLNNEKFSDIEETASVKDYCGMSTLPIDELEDLQFVPKQSEEEKQKVNDKVNVSADVSMKDAKSVDTSKRTSKSKEKSSKNTKTQEVEMKEKEVEVRKSRRSRKRPAKFEDQELEQETASSATESSSDDLIKEKVHKEAEVMNVRKSNRSFNQPTRNEDEVLERKPFSKRSLKNKKIAEKDEETKNIQVKMPGHSPKISVKDAGESSEEETLSNDYKGGVYNLKKKRVQKIDANVRKPEQSLKRALKGENTTLEHVPSTSSRKSRSSTIKKKAAEEMAEMESKNESINSNKNTQTSAVANREASLETPRSTRRRKAEDVEEASTEKSDNRSNKNTNNKQSKAVKAKLEVIPEDESNVLITTESSYSDVPTDVSTKATVNRRSKRMIGSDNESRTTATPNKRNKIAESPSDGATSSRTSTRRGKNLLNTDSETSVRSTPIKKKTVESSSEGESSSNRTPARSKRKQQLNETLNTPERSKRKQQHKVVFTMLDSPELESLIRRLGGKVVDSVDACTVLVTGSLKRSQKLLSAVGLGKPICSPKWLHECKKANTFLDPWDFILEDKEAETKWKVSLKESLARSTNNKLLENYTVFVSVTTATDVLKGAIESCGGKCVLKAPSKTTDTNFIVVGNPENKTKFSKFLKQQPPVTVVSPEAIFDGVLRQELHLQDHLLSL